MKPDNETKNDKVRTAWFALAGVLAVLLGLGGGCAPNALERDFGHSVAHNIGQQTVNPQAGLTVASPTVGLSPKAAANTLERYDKSFKGEEKAGTALKMISGY